MNIEGFGVGDANKKLTGIESTSGCKIEMSSSKDRSLTFLITGKQADVLKAKRMILVDFQTQANATIHIPKEHHRFLLGKGGSKLQELERQTATKITIPKAQDSTDGAITVVGARDGIEKALFEIQKISDEQSKQAFEKLEVPKIYHPFVCGANNANIQVYNELKVLICFNTSSAGLDSQAHKCEDQHPPIVGAQGRALHHRGEGRCARREGRHRRHLERHGEEVLHYPGDCHLVIVMQQRFPLENVDVEC